MPTQPPSWATFAFYSKCPTKLPGPRPAVLALVYCWNSPIWTRSAVTPISVALHYCPFCTKCPAEWHRRPLTSVRHAAIVARTTKYMSVWGDSHISDQEIRQNSVPWTVADNSQFLACTARWSCDRRWPRHEHPIAYQQPDKINTHFCLVTTQRMEISVCVCNAACGQWWAY